VLVEFVRASTELVGVKPVLAGRRRHNYRGGTDILPSKMPLGKPNFVKSWAWMLT